jgi:hypothetical protein
MLIKQHITYGILAAVRQMSPIQEYLNTIVKLVKVQEILILSKTVPRKFPQMKHSLDMFFSLSTRKCYINNTLNYNNKVIFLQ